MKKRLLPSIFLVILTAVNLAAHILSGGFAHTYADDLLAVPMIYFTIRMIYTEDIKLLPELIFLVRAAVQGFKYLTECGIPAIDDINFSDTLTGAVPYARTILYCFGGMAALCCGRILFQILRRVYDHKSRRKRRLMIAELGCILLAFAAAAGYVVWENNAISVSHYTYVSEKISPALSGCKIVQVSDLHNKSFGENSVFLLKKIRAEQPDLIVVTGDLVDRNHTDIDTALDFINRAAKIAPLYYITGNHEEALSLPKLYKILNGVTEAGGTVLDSEYVTISRSRGVVGYGDDTGYTVLDSGADDTFHLIGLADKNLFRGKLHYITPKSDGLNLLLAHQPQAFAHYAAEDVDLIFAGHAHGGQARLPFIGPLYAPGQGFHPQYTEGMYQYNRTTMVVSRGLGNSVFPFRINNRPELVVVELIQNSECGIRNAE